MIRCLRAVPADAGVAGPLVAARAVRLAAADDLERRSTLSIASWRRTALGVRPTYPLSIAASVAAPQAGVVRAFIDKEPAAALCPATADPVRVARRKYRRKGPENRPQRLPQVIAVEVEDQSISILRQLRLRRKVLERNVDDANVRSLSVPKRFCGLDDLDAETVNGLDGTLRHARIGRRAFSKGRNGSSG